MTKPIRVASAEAADPKSAWTTAEIYAGLEARFCHPAWALVTEVRNATGVVAKERYADALAMSLWPSRGLSLEGIEVKASRSDWTRELKNPAKADAISGYCDRWWVAVGHRDIVRTGELPDAWGLLAPGKTGKTLEVLKEAPRNEKTQPIDRAFLASLFRAAAGIHERSNARAHDDGFKSGLQQAAYEHKQLKEGVAKFEQVSGVRLESVTPWNAGNIGEVVKAVLDGHVLTLQKRVEEFEAKSGLKISDWNSGDVGEAVRLVMAGSSGGLQHVLKRLRDDIHKAAETIDGFFVEKEKAERVASIKASGAKANASGEIEA